MAWTLFVIYLVGTSYLGYLGLKRTSDFSSFAIGDGNMSPIVVGITLAASTASAATFIVNPGFVYVNGLAAFMHLGISVFFGIITMLILASYKFREIGKDNHAVTIPGWLGKRYKSKNFAIYFSLINLFSFAFLVLLVGGISIVMQELLDINNITALAITLIFVSMYVIMGGTYAHVFTNMLQGSLMIIVSLIVIISGMIYMMETPDFWQQIIEKDPNLISWVNPESVLYNNYFSVYISGFLIGAALVCQPHILTKALYVKNNKDVSRYLLVFSLVYILFTFLLMAGFWAILKVPPENLMDPVSGEFRQDLVMTEYLSISFPKWLFTIISVVLLAAAMSTLDGLMVGLSTIMAHDFFVNIFEKVKHVDKTEREEFNMAFKASHIILVIMAISCFLVSIKPPKLLGIFGQFGVYALVLASLTPLLMGMYFKKPSLILAWIASAIAISIYSILYFFGDNIFPDTEFTFANPAVPASIAILFSLIPSLLISIIREKRYNYA